jgi:hypothetical protein
MPTIKSLCSTVIVLANGSVRFCGRASDGVEEYFREVRPRADALVPLENRTDRSGDGRLRFVDAYVLGPGGAKNILPMGASAQIALSYSARAPVNACNISIHIENEWGQVILRLATLETAAPFCIKLGDGSVVCTIPQLQLLPGRYTLLIAASVPPAYEYLDYISDAAMFEVVEDDIYGTGKVPEYGTFFTKCVWHQEQLISGIREIGEETAALTV